LLRLYSKGFSAIDSWGGGEWQEDDRIVFPFSNYNQLVEEFFGLASSECWADYEYQPEEAGRMLRDENLVKRASLSQIRMMLTFCVRGERFSTGHWAAMIEKGYIRQLFERLIEIGKEQMK